ncbi:hypothetical protein M0R88_18070 [Halorussus gelatinilyticus]|uniref:Uncharacterized protein n=1 Tax=Halorussus gelatinilyticus TaxID=2937524 RepID=A0A8U0IK16_9EURY|nr:hypothetical protein [Halorussus gelatinilyticus]UPW00399.1 hypothetical protein M0R88_18070 [Halorussus gelatinilyticus]
MARDVTARDSKSETALLDRRSARWHAGPAATAAGRGTAASSEPNSAGTPSTGTMPSAGAIPSGATLFTGESTPSTRAASGAEVQNGS